MISSINQINNNVKFCEEGYTHDTLLKNTPVTRFRIGADKLINALTVYPAKGLKGSKNANFYEFLTMGTVPYLIGSGTLMSVFNLANKYYSPFARQKASSLGNRLALGVLFYGIMKNLSKSFISKPVKMLTGIDIEQPYAKVVYELPDDINDTDITSIEHHKVFESVEFPRWDLHYTDQYGEKNRNSYYDNVAKRLGMGKNLKDSDQEVKPRIKEIVIKASAAKSISSYLWAASGVAFAFQKPWDKYLRTMTFKFWKGKEFLKSLETFKDSFIESALKLYKGEGKNCHAGKILLGSALISSFLGVMNTIHSSNKPEKAKMEDVIQKDKGYIKA